LGLGARGAGDSSDAREGEGIDIKADILMRLMSTHPRVLAQTILCCNILSTRDPLLARRCIEIVGAGGLFSSPFRSAIPTIAT
jgi:hypothetical protein